MSSLNSLLQISKESLCEIDSGNSDGKPVDRPKKNRLYVNKLIDENEMEFIGKSYHFSCLIGNRHGRKGKGQFITFSSQTFPNTITSFISLTSQTCLEKLHHRQSLNILYEPA